MDIERKPEASNLLFVHPSEVHAYWGYVKPRLEIVGKKSQARWIPEDVYNAIKNGTATLHIAEVGDDYVGFLVLCPSPDFDGKALTIWAAYGEKGVDVVELFEPELSKCARMISAKRLSFTSPRRWERRLSKRGWQVVSQVFEKEV